MSRRGVENSPGERTGAGRPIRRSDPGAQPSAGCAATWRAKRISFRSQKTEDLKRIREPGRQTWIPRSPHCNFALLFLGLGLARGRAKGTKSSRPISRARVHATKAAAIRAALASGKGKGILKTARVHQQE